MKNFEVYLAGPMCQMTLQQANVWRLYVEEELARYDVRCRNPFRAKELFFQDGNVIGLDYDRTPLQLSDKYVLFRDRYDVLASDLLFISFLNAKEVSIGTVMEISWATLLRKPTIIVMEPDNIHNHPMITESTAFIVPTLEDGIEVTVEVLNV